MKNREVLMESEVVHLGNFGSNMHRILASCSKKDFFSLKAIQSHHANDMSKISPCNWRACLKIHNISSKH
jgi:hypothetical protein